MVAWVETSSVLGMFDGDTKAYREYVEAGKGEKAVNPFERAVAGIALGAEGFVSKIRSLASGVVSPQQVPALRELERLAALSPAVIEAAVEEVFDGESERRKGVIKMYALRSHSGMRPIDIARRYNKTPAAVSLAKRRLNDLASSDPDLAMRLQRLSDTLATMKRQQNKE